MLRTTSLVGILIIALATSAFAADVRLADAAKLGDIDAVRSLLKERANVYEAQGDGMTPLHWAVYTNNFDVAQLLVKAGANVKAVTRLDSSTPLSIAATNGNLQIMDLLIKAGADVNAASSLGTTPLMQAAASGNLD